MKRRLTLSNLSSIEVLESRQLLTSLSIADISVGESAGQFSAEVRLSDALAAPAVFAIATSDGSATQGEDYATKIQVGTIPAGDLSLNIDFAVIADEIAEGNETFFLTLTPVVNATIADGSATVTIIDDDEPVTPSAQVSVPTIRDTQEAQTVTVTYPTWLGSAADISTIDRSDLLIENGIDTFSPDVKSIEQAPDGLAVVYELTGELSRRGNYDVRLNEGAVTTLDGTPYPGGVLAGFVVDHIITPAHQTVDFLDTFRDVQAADIDRDGDNDLVAHAGDDQLALIIYENRGNFGFSKHVIAEDGISNTRHYQSVDLDGDRDLDVVVTKGGVGVSWYENTGDFIFQEHVVNPVTTAPFQVDLQVADLNADGHLDIVVANNSLEILWYENDGNQNFAASKRVHFGEQIARFVVVDADGDGDTDVLLASQLKRTVILLENDGSQNFSARTVTTSPIGVTTLIAVDLDRDGDGDFVAASERDDQLVWYENDGSGKFLERLISEGPAYLDAIPVDLDQDGDLDLVTPIIASIEGSELSWFENEGDTKFTRHPMSTFPPNFSTRRVLVTDIDRDHEPDLVFGHSIQPRIQWSKLGTKDGLAPVATAETEDVTSLALDEKIVTVTYIDNQTISSDSIRPDNIRIRQGNSLLEADTVVSQESSFGSNGIGLNTRVVQYSFPRPPHGWNSFQSTEMEIEVAPFQVRDVRGNFMPPGVIGTFKVEIPDTRPPIASALALDVAEASTQAHIASVTFVDDLGVQPAISESNIEVLGPDGGTLRVLVPESVIFPPTLSPVVADYRILPPGGSWDSTDNGSYTIRLRDNQIQDVSGNFAVGRVIGSFAVDIAESVVPESLPGDANGDGIVGFSDFAALARNFGRRDATLAEGDFNNDSIVSFGDFAILARNFGRRLNSA